MSHPSIAVIVPTFNALAYSRRVLLSLFKYTPGAKAIVVDDCSPQWDDKWYKGTGGEVVIHRFKKNGGLTRSWNHGLDMCRSLDVEYVVCGNNDILFSMGWWRGMQGIIENHGIGLAGPLSNAPGITAKGLQEVQAYVHNYQLTDSARYNNQLSQMLWESYKDRPVVSPVNGFLMFARKELWYSNQYDDRHVFCPVNRFTSKGKKNPTPFMTCNEDEFQRRLRRNKVKSGIALGSYVFHYRSVSRGQKRYGKGQFTKLTDPNKPV